MTAANHALRCASPASQSSVLPHAGLARNLADLFAMNPVHVHNHVLAQRHANNHVLSHALALNKKRVLARSLALSNARRLITARQDVQLL